MYAISAMSAGRAPPTQAPACYYDGNAYSVGALALMGRIEKVCMLAEDLPTWERE